jgi:2-methylisocitrate lyase-like PEP mutase family enzyme
VTLPPTQEQKGVAFQKLHKGDAFVMPNPWDAGSAKVLAALGFEAVASTSSGTPTRSARCARATTKPVNVLAHPGSR